MSRHKKILKGVAAILALGLLFSLSGSYTTRLEGVFRDLTTPIQGFFLQGVHRLKAGVDSVRGFNGLAEENRRLDQEVIALQAGTRVRENLEEENLRLRKLLDFRDQQSIQLIPAQVVQRSMSSWWQSVGLGRGTRVGVEANRAVISPDGLVGKTTRVFSRTAEVLLVSDPAFKVSARISRTGSFGLVIGRGVNLKGDPVARMQFIHKETPVRMGDEVVTSGLGGIFPRDIPIGYVEEIHMEEAGLYQYVDMMPQAIVHLTDVVFVVATRGEAE